MNSKKIITICLGIVVLVVIAVMVFFTYDNVREKREHEINLYFLNSATNVLSAERREITKGLDENGVLDNVISELMAGPKNTALVNAVVEGVSIENYEYYRNAQNLGRVDVDLSEGYNDLPESRKLLCIGAIVYTLTDLDFVDNVRLYVSGEPIKSFAGNEVKLLDRDNVLNNPQINPDKINRRSVVLYFKNSKGELESEERSIEVKQSLTLEYQIVEQLILGPTETELTPTVPSETKIRDIKTEDGICYVNLSSEFVNKSALEENAGLLAVYSVVNSLTELETVEKVQFLIEGEKLNDFNGQFDFSKTFARNDEVIANG